MNYSIKKFDMNLIGNDYVVGDIHGCYDTLIRGLHKLKFNPVSDRLFCTGDLTDRGNESLKVVELLKTSWFFSVLGNHEYLVMNARNNNTAAETLMCNGGLWFAQLEEHQQSNIEAMLSELPLVIEIETRKGIVAIIHADVPEIESWGKLHDMVLSGNNKHQLQQQCIWSRTTFEMRNISHRKPIPGISKVFLGHSIVPNKSPLTIGNMCFIDSGAFLGNKLNIIKL